MDTATNVEWVTARAKCSIRSVFEKIRLDVQADVKARMEMRGPTPYYLFEIINADSGDTFTVVLSGNGVPHKAAQFSLLNESIRSEDADGLKTEATLTLNDAGDCRLKIKGQEREFWQFRRMALESLFFNFVRM